MAEFAKRNPEAFDWWYTSSMYIVVLSAPHLKALENIHDVLLEERIPLYDFKEPDINNEMTGFAVHPKFYNEAKRLLSSLPLAGKRAI